MPSYESTAIKRAERGCKNPRRRPKPEDVDPLYKRRCELLWRLIDLAGVPPSRTSGSRAQVIQQHESLLEEGRQLANDIEILLNEIARKKGESNDEN